MTLQILTIAAVLLVAFAIAALVFTLRAMDWGATAQERSMPMPGDAYFYGDPRPSVVMTRAISIDAPMESVWPWLAQLGRGAGWYRYDLLDNGAKMSARLVIRMSGDATDGLPGLTIALFKFIDSVMARRQLLGIKKRVERYGARTSNPDRPETGARDQYQHWEVVYHSGKRAGTSGKEHADVWRLAAVEAGLMPDAGATRKEVGGCQNCKAASS